jgi:biotin transport system substrate-specific component
MTAGAKHFSTYDIVMCGMFTALMAAGAYIKIMIPLGVWQVTFSMQIFVAVLCGFLMGAGRGFLSVLSYLIVGLCGVPVFAHGGGLGYVLKPTFGFLIGFAAAASVTGFLYEKAKSRSAVGTMAIAFAGEMAYYACGLVYYYVMFNFFVGTEAGIGLRELVSVWFLSTVVPDFVLCALAGRLALRLEPYFRSVGNTRSAGNTRPGKTRTVDDTRSGKMRT